MKVAIVINTSWNIYNFRMGLISNLLNNGHQVLTIAPEDAFSQSLKDAGCEYIPLKMDNTGSNPFKDLFLIFKLKKIYSGHKPDIIYHFTVKPNIYGTLAARLCKIPVINNVSGLGTVFLSDGFSSIVAKWLYKISFKTANLVLFQNKDDEGEFRSQITILDFKTDILPGSGINLNKFKTDVPLPTNGIIFIMIARLIIEKGVIEYLDAAREVKKKFLNSTMLLLGKPENDHVRGVSNKILDGYLEDGSISYLGEVDDILPHIEQATCVVLPSYREGTSRTLLEAAALSRPIITADVAGCKETLIPGKTGLLCAVKSAKSLADQMKVFCALSHKEHTKMGKKGRNYIESKFDENIVIQKYINHTSNILNKIPS